MDTRIESVRCTNLMNFVDSCTSVKSVESECYTVVSEREIQRYFQYTVGCFQIKVKIICNQSG